MVRATLIGFELRHRGPAPVRSDIMNVTEFPGITLGWSSQL